QLIELNLRKMETADARLAYVNQILGADGVAPEVRSSVAVVAAKLMSERGQPDQTEHMLSEAVRLNNLNLEALRLRYETGMKDLSDFQKVQALINMIKANPLQPWAVAELADRLADFGLV